MRALHIAEWREYSQECAHQAREARYAAENVCPSCGGTGDHGVEPDTGCLFVCYSCAGTGKYFFSLT
jgi:hypothetical protein